MALLFFDSFDHYVTGDMLEKWAISSIVGSGTTLTVSAGSGRHASAALRWTTGTGSTQEAAVNRVLAPADTTAIIGFAVKVSAVDAVSVLGMGLSSIREAGGSVQVTLRLNSDLTLSVLRGTAGGTVLGTTASAISLGTAVFVEWRVTIHPSAGTVDVRVNGASQLSLTGQNTRSTANTIWGAVGLGHQDVGRASQTAGRFIDFDDFYVCDGSGAAPWNTFLGDVRADVRTITANGALAQWTPSTGSNFQTVDDNPPNDDTDYNAAPSSGVTDTFVVQDAPVPGATLFGVQVSLSARKTDAGSCSLASVVRQSGSNQVAAAQNPSTGYTYLSTLYQTNPHTSAQWTEANFNADEFGYQRTV